MVAIRCRWFVAQQCAHLYRYHSTLEILEAAYPVRFTQWALRANSGGDGQHRGGLGAVYEIELLEESAEVFIFGERGKASPKGIAGGQPALPNVFEYENDGIWKTPPMVSKMLGIRLKKASVCACKHRVVVVGASPAIAVRRRATKTLKEPTFRRKKHEPETLGGGC